MSGVWSGDGGSSSGPYTIQGNWNASINSPDLTTVTTSAYAWVVSVAGTTTLGGINTWNLGDIAVKTQGGWARILPSSATWGTIIGTIADQVDLQNLLSLKANDNAVVKLTTNQTVAGVKTFSSSPNVPAPIADANPSTKKYTDDGLVLKQDRPASATENNLAVFDANKDTKDSGKAFTESLSPTDPSHNKVPTEKAVEDRVGIINKLLLNELSNGIKEGMTISINSDNTKIDISAGLGIIINDTDSEAPSYTLINLAGFTGITLNNLASANATYIAINELGEVEQQTTEFTSEQRRGLIILGVAIHSNRTYVNVVNNLPDVALNSASQLNDLMNALQNFNISGNIISANGANLSINKSEGYIFKKGSNFKNSALNPHTLHLNALVAPSTLRYRLQNGTEYPNTAVIDPSFYDLGGVKTPVPPNKYSIQRFTLFPSNLIRIQYGQAYYGSMAEAIQAIATESFVEEDNIAQNGLLRGLMVVKSGATDLSIDTQAQFFEADRFGASKFSAGGSATTTLQQAYNNSLQPQITTDATHGAVQFKRGSSADTDAVKEVLNGAGVAVNKMLGNGSIIMPKESGTGFRVDPVNPGWGWKDLVGQISPRVGGAAAPAFTAFRGGAVRNYAFGVGDIIDNMTFHMPHDWVPGTDLYLHVHWGHNGTAIAGTLAINYHILYAKGYNQAGQIFQAEKTYNQIIPVTSVTTHPRWGHFIDEFKVSTPGGSATLLDTNILEVDGLLEVALDVSTIPTITGSAASNLPYIFMVDIHYQSNQMSTKGRNYPFYT